MALGGLWGVVGAAQSWEQAGQTPRNGPGRARTQSGRLEAPRESPSHRSRRKGRSESAFAEVLLPDHTRNEKTFRMQTQLRRIKE